MQAFRLPYGETVTVLRRATRDRTGDGGFTEHATIGGCAFAWDSVDEDMNRRETAEVWARVHVPKSADIIASDRIERANGDQYMVVGKPQWDNVHPMTGWDSGYKEIRLKGVF